MNNLSYNINTLGNKPESHEFVLQFDDSDSHQNLHEIDQVESITVPWNPSNKLKNLHNTFQQTVGGRSPPQVHNF